MTKKLDLTKDEINIIREWFGVAQDFNPEYLEPKDYKLAKRIYEYLRHRVPKSIFDKI